MELCQFDKERRRRLNCHHLEWASLPQPCLACRCINTQVSLLGCRLIKRLGRACLAIFSPVLKPHQPRRVPAAPHSTNLDASTTRESATILGSADCGNNVQSRSEAPSGTCDLLLQVFPIMQQNSRQILDSVCTHCVLGTWSSGPLASPMCTPQTRLSRHAGRLDA